MNWNSREKGQKAQKKETLGGEPLWRVSYDLPVFPSTRVLPENVKAGGSRELRNVIHFSRSSFFCAFCAFSRLFLYGWSHRCIRWGRVLHGAGQLGIGPVRPFSVARPGQRT